MARIAKYTLESLKETVANKKMTRSGDLRKFNASAYAAAARNGWLKDLFAEASANTKAVDAKPKARKVKEVSAPVADAEVPTSVVVTLSGITTIKQLNEARVIASRNKLGFKIENEAA